MCLLPDGGSPSWSRRGRRFVPGTTCPGGDAFRNGRVGRVRFVSGHIFSRTFLGTIFKLSTRRWKGSTMKIESWYEFSGVMQLTLEGIALKADGIFFLKFGDGCKGILGIFNILLSEILDREFTISKRAI